MKATNVMDEFVQVVSVAGGLTPDRASEVVQAVLRFLGSRLPSPLFGQLQDRLQSSSRDDVGPAQAGVDPPL